MKQSRIKTGFTLAELIIAVAMLAFFSTFIAQMFFKAEQLTVKSRELDLAVAVATDLADQWKRQSEVLVLPEILELRQEAEPGHMLKLYFDADFISSSEENSVYVAALTVQEKREDMHGSMRMLRIVICRSEPDDRGAIYTLWTGRSTDTGEKEHE